jgi:hypothetical protein
VIQVLLLLRVEIWQALSASSYSAVAFATLYTSKHPINSADLLNDRVIPFFDQHQVPLLRMLTAFFGIINSCEITQDQIRKFILRTKVT